MLIKDGNLDFSEFRSVVKKLDWTKITRNLDGRRNENFFIGRYEDEFKVIKVSVRPSFKMQISESYKNKTADGKIPSKNYNGPLYNFGTTIEVEIDQSFIDELDKISVPAGIKDKKVFKWRN